MTKMSARERAKNSVCRKCGICFSQTVFRRMKFGSICQPCRVEEYKNAAKKRRLFLKQHKPWYITYHSIKARCNNPSSTGYDRYGLRGIKCLLSLDDLKMMWFRDNASSMKKPSIHRLDPNGNYEVQNCKFIEMSENIRLAVHPHKIFDEFSHLPQDVRYKKRHMRDGLCTACSNKAFNGLMVCKKHRDKMREISRRVYAIKKANKTNGGHDER